ncbi:hypothetical protein [Actinoplanes sp. NPDC051859]|uniref:hypothetical protein n=1 Tax=Actinoplanes sp. NPDC051859 TaxID=3363909 RepID=UPI0037AD1454
MDAVTALEQADALLAFLARTDIGMAYQRDAPDDTSRPLPPGVDGYAYGTRTAGNTRRPAMKRCLPLSEAAERAVLILIMIGVGVLAGWTAVGHVIDWTMRNSPAGTSSSVAITNAAASELVPIACALVIRRRRRLGLSIRWPVVFLVAAVAFSLSAQLAVAKPGVSGWIVSAVPSLAFLGITKMCLSLMPIVTPAAATTLQEIRVATGATEALSVGEPQTTAESSSAGRDPVLPPQPHSSFAAPEPTVDRQANNAAPSERPRRARTVTSAQRVRPRSLTSAAKVEAAWKALPAGASVEQIAVKAGVSVSTARRHLPSREADPAATADAVVGADGPRLLAATAA